MKKTVVWLVVSCWVIAALLLASCAPAVVEEEEANMLKWTGTKLDGTAVEKMIEKPRYGGVHVFATDSQPTMFDDIVRNRISNWAINPVSETLLDQDWLRGPQGTGEWSGLISISHSPLGIYTGLLAENWEMPEPDTLVFHIRHGVHWALDSTSEASRLVGGREVTAADVVFGLRREWTIGYQSTNYRNLIDMDNIENSIYVSPADKWAVVIKSLPGLGELQFMAAGYFFSRVVAPEVIEQYGDMNDWRNVVGTGPFMLENYIDASALTYVRNPGYWMHDPFFPENQLPYLDTFSVLIIPDISSRMAGLRVGKIDTLYNLNAEDAESLMKTTPELEGKSYLENAPTIYVRNDQPPFNDIRVRRSLAMAIDNQEILDLYYEGKGALFTYPIMPVVEFMDMYTPLEEMPESVQELYGYHPNKARQLLAEAGYPEGFKTKIITLTKDVDLLSIIKEYWAIIGVDLELDVKEYGAYSSIEARKTYEQMLMRSMASNTVWALPFERLGGFFNFGKVNEPWVRVLYLEMTRRYFLSGNERQKVLTEPMAEGLPNWITYANEQAWFMVLPNPHVYVLWQPWLKGYHGAYTTLHSPAWPRFVWIDQELKEAMGR